MTKTIKFQISKREARIGTVADCDMGDVNVGLMSLPDGHYTITVEPDRSAALEVWLSVPENARNAAELAPKYSVHAPKFSASAFISAAVNLSGTDSGVRITERMLEEMRRVPGVFQDGVDVFRFRAALPDGWHWDGNAIRQANDSRHYYTAVDGTVVARDVVMTPPPPSYESSVAMAIPRWVFEAFIAEGLL